MLTTGLRFLQSRLRGLSSSSSGWLLFCLGFLHILYVYTDTFAFFGFALVYEGKILRALCLQVFFSSILCIYLLTGIPFESFIFYLDFGVVGLANSLGCIGM